MPRTLKERMSATIYYLIFGKEPEAICHCPELIMKLFDGSETIVNELIEVTEGRKATVSKELQERAWTFGDRYGHILILSFIMDQKEARKISEILSGMESQFVRLAEISTKNTDLHLKNATASTTAQAIFEAYSESAN